MCGSTQGISRATAISLANEGAKITLIARNENKLKAVLSNLKEHKVMIILLLISLIVKI